MIKEYNLKKKSLEDYKVLEEPGTYIIKCNGCSSLYTKDEFPRYIVNLKVATIKGFEKCLNLMGTKEVIDIKKVSDCFLTGVIWENQIANITDLPIKGEELIANFDIVDGELKCTSINLMPRKKLNSFQLSSICKSRQLLKNILLNEKN